MFATFPNLHAGSLRSSSAGHRSGSNKPLTEPQQVAATGQKMQHTEGYRDCAALAACTSSHHGPDMQHLHQGTCEAFLQQGSQAECPQHKVVQQQQQWLGGGASLAPNERKLHRSLEPGPHQSDGSSGAGHREHTQGSLEVETLQGGANSDSQRRHGHSALASAAGGACCKMYPLSAACVATHRWAPDCRARLRGRLRMY